MVQHFLFLFLGKFNLMNKKIRVLIVEDDPFLGLIVKESFETRGYEAKLAENGNQGFEYFHSWKPDVCILDIMMPEKDGFTLAEEIRDVDIDVPIIFLTARTLTEDVVKAFSIGANDYVKKPFSMEELIARVKAILNRIEGVGTNVERDGNYKIGKFSFDYKRLTLVFNDITQKLTPREADLLKLLCDYKNSMLERKKALDNLWGDDNYFNGRSLDVFITKLRKYLSADTGIEIISIRGKGFRLILSDD